MDYSDIIFTNHATVKLKDRQIAKNDALETIVHPDKSYPGKKSNTMENTRKFEGYEVTAITKRNDKKQMIALSVWRNPALPGTADAKQNATFTKYRKSSALGKIWIAIRQQLGF